MNHDPTAHRRRSIRLQAWDYRQAGAYYVTICTYQRECIFTDASLAGIAEAVWREVAASCGPLDEFVIMPNHVHGVIWIAESETPAGAQQRQHPPTVDRAISQATKVHRQTPVDVAAPLQRLAFARRPVESGSLSAIIRTFKSATAKRINRLRETPGRPLWQRNYYEHIVRG